MNKTRRVIFWASTFFVPLILLSTIWISLGIAPFGDKLFLISDIGTQYLDFMGLFKKIMLEGYNAYSFSNGIGGSIEALSTYYLISPFNLIFLFFNEAQFPVIVIVVMSLKISCLGTAMAFYLKKHYGELRWAIILFSTAYSFSGFVVAYCFNFMWLDSLICFPFVILGLEKLWRGESSLLYITSLFLAIITNYYLGYMICLFAVVYSIYLYYLQGPHAKKQRFRNTWFAWKKFFIVSGLTGISTSFILIPSIMGMLKTAKTDFSPSSFFPDLRFGLAAFSQLGVGTYQFEMRLDHLPGIYAGLLVALFFVAYFMLPELTKRTRRASIGLILVMFLSLLIELFNTIWHMFQSPAGFPYRNVFIISFLMISFSYQAYLSIMKNRQLQLLKRSVLILVGLLLLGELGITLDYTLMDTKLLDAPPTNPHFSGIVSVLLVMCYYLLFSLKTLTTKYRKISLTVIALIFFSELTLNYYTSIKDVKFGSQAEFAAYYTEQKNVLDQLQLEDTVFRINQKSTQSVNGFAVKYNSYNDSMLYGFNDVASYTSTVEKDSLDTLINLGMFSKNERRYSYVDANPLLDLLLGIKYELKPTKETGQQISDHLFTRENEAFIGMGFPVNKQFETVNLKADDVITNQENVLQGIHPSTAAYFSPFVSQNQLPLETKVLHYTGSTTAAGELFLYIPEIKWRNVTALSVNGKKIKTDLRVSTNQLFNLGYFLKNESVTLTVSATKKVDVSQLQMASLDETHFNQLIHSLKPNGLTLKKNGRDTYESQLPVLTQSELYYLSIPYDDNWRVKIDGKEVVAKKVLGSQMAINIPKQSKKITLYYQATGTLIGVFISTITVLGTLYYLLIRFIKHK